MSSFCKVLGTAVGVATVGSVVAFMGLCTYLTLGEMHYRMLDLGTDARKAANELFNEAETGFKLAQMR